MALRGFHLALVEGRIVEVWAGHLATVEVAVHRGRRWVLNHVSDAFPRGRAVTVGRLREAGFTRTEVIEAR